MQQVPADDALQQLNGNGALQQSTADAAMQQGNDDGAVQQSVGRQPAMVQCSKVTDLHRLCPLEGPGAAKTWP
jgi:hypothetical protein